MPVYVRYLPRRVLESTVSSLRSKGFACTEDTILGARVVRCSKRLNELSDLVYLLVEEG
jgi:hypothetical protein